MATFRVWDAEDAEPEPVEIAAGAGPYDALDAEDAAEEFCERRYHLDDYQEERTVCVQDPRGAVTRWRVRTERVVEFIARKVQ